MSPLPKPLLLEGHPSYIFELLQRFATRPGQPSDLVYFFSGRQAYGH